jgi:DNA-binding beta-propeller fold protein YncE
MTGEEREAVDQHTAQRGGTRRRFIGGVAAAGAAHTLVGPLLSANAGQTKKPCAPDPPGIPTGAIAITPNGRTVWSIDTHATTITAHRSRDLQRGRSIDVGGAPTGIAISPHGDVILVTTAFYDTPALALIDVLTGEVDHVDVGPEPGAVAFTHDGRSAYVAGGGAHGTLTRVELRSGHVHTPIEVGAHPHGLALHPDGKRALVALNGAGAVAVVALARRKVERRIPTSRLPSQLALSKDGTRAFVTHNGFGDQAVTPIDVTHRRARRQVRVGRDPAGVAFSASGATALVTAAGSGTIVMLDSRTGRRRRTVKRGGVPRGVAVSGSRAVVADARTGRLTAIRLGVLR